MSLQCFIAPSKLEDDPCRKPATGMWDYMVQYCSYGVTPGGLKTLCKRFCPGAGQDLSLPSTSRGGRGVWDYMVQYRTAAACRSTASRQVRALRSAGNDKALAESAPPLPWLCQGLAVQCLLPSFPACRCCCCCCQT